MILFSEGKEVERVIGATSKESISGMIEKYSSLASCNGRVKILPNRPMAHRGGGSLQRTG